MSDTDGPKGTEMTPQRRKLADAIVNAANDPNSPWKVAGPNTISYTETLNTPDDFRGDGFAKHPYPTFNRHVSLTLAAGTPILGVARAPWVGGNQSYLTIKRAHEILADPAHVFRR